jgi:hypothetical protein
MNVTVKIYKTLILPLVFETRIVRGIFGPSKDEVTGEWSKLHNEEFHNL